MQAADTIISLFEPFYSENSVEIDDTNTTTAYPKIEIDTLHEICNYSQQVLNGTKALIYLESPVVVVGDIHGNLKDLLQILFIFGPPPSTPYLFLGDFVDRGKYSVSVIGLILAFKCKYPDKVFLLRGNHEFSHINHAYGFYAEVLRDYNSEELWNLFQTVFSYFPLAAIIHKSVFCVHGGLSPYLNSVESLLDLPMPFSTYFNNQMISDLVWSDPVDTVSGFQLNHRGSGQIFGPDVVANFLKSNNLKVMLRGHQCTLAGYKPFANLLGVTVFSSSNYCNNINNKAGAVTIKEDRVVSFYSLIEREMGIMPEQVMSLPLDGNIGLKKMVRAISTSDFRSNKTITPMVTTSSKLIIKNNEDEHEEEEEHFQSHIAKATHYPPPLPPTHHHPSIPIPHQQNNNYNPSNPVNMHRSMSVMDSLGGV